MTIKSFINFLEEEKYTEAKEAFESALAEKVTSKLEAKKVEISSNISSLNETLVFVDDGSDYGDEPDPKDLKYFDTALKKYKGKFDSNTDKGPYFKFSSKSDAENFIQYLKKSPQSSFWPELRENTNETKKVEFGKKISKENLEKDSDDPCWDGYVQLGTKMKDGKEVPNCVPKEEANNK